MIKVSDRLEETGAIKLNMGDILRLPIKMNWLNECQTIEFIMHRSFNEDCTIRDKEVNFADLVNFKCENQGQFKIRVRGYDTKGFSQFAIYINGKKLGRGFKDRANSISEYVTKIANHYKKLKGWDISTRGNIIVFNQNANCESCGGTVEIRLGDYAVLNTNSPCLNYSYVGLESVIGTKCYSLKIKNILQGNEITVNGIKYIVTANDTIETLTNRILNGKKQYCIPTGTTLTTLSEEGKRTVLNTNNPQITASFDHADSLKDYYLIKVYDVREGNRFSVNNNQKTASISDTVATIETYYNNDGGYYSTEKGVGINPSAITGTRNVTNTSAAIVTFSLVSEVPTANKKKYLVSICEDVRGGNSYTLGNKNYVAKNGDTATDVAYNLVLSNSPTFNYYIDEGTDIISYSDKGFREDERNIANVEAIDKTVICCEKESMIFEFEAKEQGIYFAEFKNESGSTIGFSDRFCVQENLKGELVEFNNEGNSFGFDADISEWFSIRLPIFLRDKTFPTYEEVNENTRGEQVRSVARIGVEREFVVFGVETELHEKIQKVLRSKNLKINGVGYTFMGEYNLSKHREGYSDNRTASGTLKENGLIYSLEGC